MNTYDVFLLTSEYRDETTGHELRFYGKNQELGPVELIFTEQLPVFFIEAEEKLPALDFKIERKDLNLKTFKDRPVQGLYFTTGADQRSADDRFKATGVRHFEADVRPAERFLMERFINGMARIAGESETKNGLTTFRNPKIKASSAPTPDLSAVSLDIETGVSEDKLYSIGVHFKDTTREIKHVFMLADRKRVVHEELTFFASQRDLLEAFFVWFQEVDPDLILGWHVIGFDLMYLERKCRDFSINLDLARNSGKVVLTDKPGVGSFADISGRVVIDGIPALRGSGFSFPNFKLETVARILLGQGKLIASDNNKVAEIERQFREEKEALARYNLEDCVLVTQLFEKVDLIRLMIERTRTSGMLMDQLGLPTGALDHFLLPRLHRKGLVAPAQRAELAEVDLPSETIYEPRAGAYQHVAMLEFVNVLPSLIQVFKIDPLALVRAQVHPVTAPSGQKFSGTEHLLPDLFGELMRLQAERKQSGQATAAKACELTMKQLCKAFSHKSCRYHEPEILQALAGAEKWLVTSSAMRLEQAGFQVLYADNEMLLVLLKEGETLGAGKQLATLLNGYWQTKLLEEFGVSSIEVIYKCHFEKLVIPQVRYKDGQPICRYAALKSGAGDQQLVLEGMDSVLSEWTELAREFNERMWMKWFREPGKIEDWMIEQIKQLKNGDHNDRLIYRKKIRKDIAEYGKNPPPHIKAARLLDRPGREVRYVFTKRGPEPVEIKPRDMDYEHYLSKQLEPVADLILGLTDKKLSKLEEPEQMGLF